MISIPRLWMVAGAVLPQLLLMRRPRFPVTGALSYTLIARALGARTLVFNFAIGVVLASLCWYAFEKLGVQLGGFIPVLGL